MHAVQTRVRLQPRLSRYRDDLAARLNDNSSHASVTVAGGRQSSYAAAAAAADGFLR